MKKLIFLPVLMMFSSFGQADDSSGVRRPSLLEAVFHAATTAKAMRAKIPKESSYISITEAREICFLEGKLSAELSQVNQFASTLSAVERGYLSASMADETQVEGACHGNGYQGYHVMSPQDAYEVVDRIVTSMDLILEMN